MDYCFVFILNDFLNIESSFDYASFITKKSGFSGHRKIVLCDLSLSFFLRTRMKAKLGATLSILAINIAKPEYRSLISLFAKAFHVV